MNISTITKLITSLPLPAHYKKNIDARIPKLVEILKADSKLEFLYASTLFISPNVLKTLHKSNLEHSIFDKNLVIKENQVYGAYGVADIESYLEGDILAKVDRATMRVALEGREPFLDHKVIEFAMQLPDSMKLRDGQTKWILRQILYKYVPKELIERPKMGFGIPLDNWLKTLLKNDLIELTNDKGFMEVFKLDETQVRRMVLNFLDDKGFSSHFIWYLFCLHQWYLRWVK